MRVTNGARALVQQPFNLGNWSGWDGETCIATCAETRALALVESVRSPWRRRALFDVSVIRQDAVVRRATLPEERGPTEAWPREGKLELTEALRSHDRS